MSELDPAEVAARSPRMIPERFRKEFETPAAERAATGEREGLPPNYRMRADAHYVDQLTSRSPDMSVRFIAATDIDGGRVIDPASLESLVESIRAHGVLQPLLVRRDESRYRVIAGRRRLAAAALAGVSSVPCVVHQVDAAKADELARAENVRSDEAAAVVAAPEVPRDALLSQLVSDVEEIRTAASSLANHPLPTTKRVSLDVVRSQTARAAWMLQAADLVDGRAQGEARLCRLGHLLDEVRAGLLPESRLSRIAIDLCVPDWNVSAVVNERAVLTGLTGALIATFALLDQHDGAMVNLMIVGGGAEPVSIDVAQDSVAVSSELSSRFFDPTYTARPGGWAALLGALSVRAAARQLGGDASIAARKDRGSAIRMTIGSER